MNKEHKCQKGQVYCCWKLYVKYKSHPMNSYGDMTIQKITLTKKGTEGRTEKFTAMSALTFIERQKLYLKCQCWSSWQFNKA